MLAANIAGLRRRVADARFTVVSRAPDWTASEYGCKAVSPIGFGTRASGSEEERQALLERILDDAQSIKAGRPPSAAEGREVIEAVSAADAVIISGGGNLCISWPEHVYERAALLRLAGVYGKPAIAVGQTIGPDLGESQFKVLESAFGNIRSLGVRDYHSLGVSLSLGVSPDRLVYQLDDALFLEGSPVSPERFAFDFGREHPWIAVTIAPFSSLGAGSTSLLALSRELVRVARETGARIVLVPHVAGPDEGVSDLLFARRLLPFLGSDAPSLLIDVCTAAETQWLTSKADLVISMRYHPLVFAMAAGVPSIGVFSDYYTRVKLRGALAHAELQDWTVSLGEALNGELSARALNLWRAREAISSHLSSCRARWLASEENRWKGIVGAIEGRGHSAGIVNFTGSSEWIGTVLKCELQDGSWIRGGRTCVAFDQVRRGDLGSELQPRVMEMASLKGDTPWSSKALLPERESELISTKLTLSAREEELGSIKTVLAERDKELSSIKSVLLAKEEELLSVKAVLSERERELGSIRPVLSAKEEELQSVKTVLVERERELASIKAVLSAKEEELLSVKMVLPERERELASIKPILSAKEEELLSVKMVLSERERELGSIKPVLSAKEEELLSVKTVLSERERELWSIKCVLSAREEELQSVKMVLSERERELASIKPVLSANEGELLSVKTVLSERERELTSVKRVLEARDEELASLGHRRPFSEPS